MFLHKCILYLSNERTGFKAIKFESMNAFQRIFKIGITNDLSGEDKNRITIFNYLLFYALIMSLPMIIWMEMIDQRIMALEVTLLSSINFYCWYLIKKKRIDIAGVIFNVAYGIHTYLLAVISPDSGTKLFAFALGIVPLIILKNKLTAYFLFCLWFLLFFTLDPLSEIVSFKIILDPSESHAIELAMFSFVMLFVFFSVANFKINNQKYSAELIHKTDQLQEQKKIIETAHSEMKDSITYAKRIQNAILPSNNELSKHIPNNFILFRPKDIISGDFYWFEKVNNISFLALADCTGHGVPGALVSVVCSNALNRSVKEFQLTAPNQILNKTRELVIENFSKNGAIVNDGMDISLCAIYQNKLIFAGANSPLWVVRKNEVIEYKGDNQPIGYYEKMEDFSDKEIKLTKNDTIYLFSDGFPDQFGGPKRKKFKYSSFKNLLIEVHSKPLAKQAEMLEKTFNEWKGNFEQIDDVSIIGFKLTNNT